VSSTMQAVVIHGRGDYRLERVPVPVPGRGEALVKVHAVGICASDLMLLDANDSATLERPDAPDPTAWYLHARLHARLPGARCVMHLHSKYATALGCLRDSRMLPIDMNTMRFFGRVALDDAFDGMARQSPGYPV